MASNMLSMYTRPERQARPYQPAPMPEPMTPGTPGSPAVPSSYGSATTNANLNLRPSVGTTGTPLTVMPNGSNAQITGPAQLYQGTPWYPVSYNGMNGFSSGKYLNVLSQYMAGTPAVPGTDPVYPPQQQQPPTNYLPAPEGFNAFYNGGNYGFQGWPNLGVTSDSLHGSDLGRNMIEEEPIAAYFNSIGQYDPTSAQGRFMESQTQRVLQGYRQAQLRNPELWLRDYLDGQRPDLMRMYDRASPEQQGYNFSRFAPPARTLPRPY